MNNYTFYEDISCEEYYEAMEGFEQWEEEIKAEMWKDIEANSGDIA